MKGKKRFFRRTPRDTTRVNHRIRAREVRVVHGEKNLVMDTREAIKLAKNAGMDLVEIAGNATPPVCRIIEYGKYKYELSKKKKASETHKQKTKEIQLRIAIDEHDYGIKLARAERFLGQGDKLHVQLRFRGRENAHRNLGFDMMNKVCGDLGTMGKVDVRPNLKGRRISMTLSPLPKPQQERNFDKHLEHISEEALAADEGDIDEHIEGDEPIDDHLEETPNESNDTGTKDTEENKDPAEDHVKETPNEPSGNGTAETEENKDPIKETE
ncbi:MAG: translation initiation factor IF-3 [Verrucomicrobia bacterium]|nr:translation initiation factor IF-3 [Verrucomicrobiota bacterium]